MNESLQDKSNGCEAAGRQFMASRNPQIGTHTVVNGAEGLRAAPQSSTSAVDTECRFRRC
jgi:hypothetical protein